MQVGKVGRGGRETANNIPIQPWSSLGASGLVCGHSRVPQLLKSRYIQALGFMSSTPLLPCDWSLPGLINCSFLLIPNSETSNHGFRSCFISQVGQIGKQQFLDSETQCSKEERGNMRVDHMGTRLRHLPSTSIQAWILSLIYIITGWLR